MGKWRKAILKSVATFGIVLAGIQLEPFILPASENPLWAFLIPFGILVLAIFLEHMEE